MNIFYSNDKFHMYMKFIWCRKLLMILKFSILLSIEFTFEMKNAHHVYLKHPKIGNPYFLEDTHLQGPTYKRWAKWAQ